MARMVRRIPYIENDGKMSIVDGPECIGTVHSKYFFIYNDDGFWELLHIPTGIYIFGGSDRDKLKKAVIELLKLPIDWSNNDMDYFKEQYKDPENRKKINSIKSKMRWN